tara:strand:- start:9 stop:548 length:540 start_codon:yes stop_codon:yes gene_type:complete
MKISGICGSLRKNSWNNILLKIVLNKIAKNKKINTEIINVSNFPLYNADIESVKTPEDVIQAKSKIKKSDLIIFSSPAYNGSYSGVMKNIVDWLSRSPQVLPGKNALVIGCTPGMSGTLLGYTHLNQLLFGLGVNVLSQPRILVSSINKKLDTDGNLIDEDLELLIEKSIETILNKITI